MKKALGVFLMTAMAFGAFADEPVADVNIAEFSGNAAVQWGVDLDSGTTGFKNSYEVNLKLNLLNNGTKSTTGDGVWGELVLKTEEDTFIGWENGDDSPEVGDEYINANKGLMGSGRSLGLKVYVDVAKIHIGPAYIGIKRGDTQTGKLKMDAAIRSADDDKAEWLHDVGPEGYTEGLVAGFENEITNVGLDVRTKRGTDSYQYTDNYALALEGELKGEGIGIDGLNVKAGVSYDVSSKTYDRTNKTLFTTEKSDKNTHTLGYSASLAYKFGLDDTFYIRPQVGFTGENGFSESNVGNVDTNTTTTNMALAAGLLFGWDEIGMDKNAGVYYLDDDMAKKVSPGVGVVAWIPLPYKSVTEVGSTKTTTTNYSGFARIMPSFYTGELIPGLTAAAYADIGVAKFAKTENGDTYLREEGKVPMAFAVGANYAIAVDEMTITPKFGLRFANAAYVDYSDAYSDSFAEKGKDKDHVFAGMGEQKIQTEDDYGITSDGNYMNLKLGVDVTGLVDNTTLSVTWQTQNILNKIDYADDMNGPKLGTLNFKAKISL